MDAWVASPSGALIVRVEIGKDRRLFVSVSPGCVFPGCVFPGCVSPGCVSPAIGGLDLIAPGAVVALRVIYDGMMTYVAGRLRLDMATWVILLVGTSADRQELDDRLCDLAVDLVEPGGYDRLKAAGAPRLVRSSGPPR
jgi:hypothetical protein